MSLVVRSWRIEGFGYVCGGNIINMKNTDTELCKVLLFSLFLFCISNPLIGQEKVNISTGIGLPELINVGMRYQHKQTQTGLSFGFIPQGEKESFISVSGDFCYHFLGISKLSNRRTWFGKTGISYFRYETRSVINKSLYLNLRIGRDFNISEKFGLELGGGSIFLLHEDIMRKVPPSGGWDIKIDFSILPSMGLGLFYRI